METKSITDLRIGVPIIGEQGWLGGITYVELLIKALGLLSEQERPKIFLVVPESKLGALDLHSHIFSMLDGFIFLGNNYRLASSLIQHPFIHCRSYSELADHIDFYYPVNSDVVPELCSGSWIPDFQHVHLPDFFPKEELVRRDGWFRKVAEKAKLAVFSSKDSEDDFRRLYPDSPAATRVLHFYALPVDDWYQADPAEVQSKYNLPDNFLICCNQFWVHKNHARLFEAFAIVRRTAPDVHLVCTGAVSEWRVRDYFDNLMKLIDRLDIKDCVHILGTIPRNDQIQLIRRSLAVIQPSLFEGWSTVIEDSRALGKSMVLSDLKVHYEQAPDHAVYFDRNSPDDLAGKISSLLPELKPGPDASREREARAKARESVLTYAREFCGIALEAQRLCGKIMPHEAGASTGHILSPVKADRGGTLAEANQSPDPSVPSVTVATSIAPKNIDNQQAAVASWFKLGFNVISVNTAEEINSLRDHFPGVTFFEASRNAASIMGKPYVFFDDVLKALDASRSEICGIVNSDIHLIANDSFREFIYAEAKDSLIYGTRIEIESLDSLKGTAYEWGFDYFFFDKSVIPLYPHSTFSIGAPWWDLWACFIPAIRNVCVKKLKNPVAYHKIHPKNWSQAVWTIFFREFISHLSDKDVAGYLPAVFLEKTKSHIAQGTFVEFSGYVVIFLDQKVKKITLDDAKFRGKAAAGAVTAAHTSGGSYPKISIMTPSFNLDQPCPSKDQSEAVITLSSADEKSVIKVSAIVSTYNAERFMRGSLEDLVRQSLYQKDKLEIVVVDSGSKQNERAIVEEFQRQYKNIVYIRTAAREGVYAAWNRGIKAARGEYITNANTDDRHRSDALEVMAFMLNRRPDIGLVYADVLITAKENDTYEKVAPTGAYQWEEFSRKFLACHNFMGPQPMWRKSFHDKYGYFDESFTVSADWEFWLRIAEGTQFLHIPEYLGLYLASSGSIEHQNIETRSEEDRRIQKIYIPEYFPEFEQYYVAILKNDPLNGDAVYWLGRIFTSLEKYDRAIDIYSSYLERNPHNAQISCRLDEVRLLSMSAPPVKAWRNAPQ